ncbi:MAG: hypothetical protein HYY18_01380 [Planctomycetes bacterium]|nr:hypothetical protein [Planctomycetota bacterium]
MRFLLAAFVTLSFSGCAAENLRDWSEVLIARGSVGLGARVDARIGGLMHPGLGGDVSLEGGLSHGPYAGVHGSLDLLFFHSEQCQNAKSSSGSGAARDCVCAGLALPLATCEGPYNWLHAADLEVSVFAGVVGIGIGISFGELLDAITNTFGLDLDPVKEETTEYPARRPKGDE